MGMGQQNQQPQGYNPQQALQGMALTPYTGTSPGGGAAQGIAQLVAALLANQKQKQMQYGLNPQTQPSMPQPTWVIPPYGAQQGVAQQQGQALPIPMAQQPQLPAQQST